jgi:FG-GAP repeat/FG-GAP-like repeat
MKHARFLYPMRTVVGRALTAMLLVSSFQAIAPIPRASATTPPAPILTLTGEAPGDRFGVSVAATGDVNGDGFPDIVVGAEWSNADAPKGGRAYVFLGGPGADAVPDFVLQVPEVQSRALTGDAVAIPGDLNGDGWNDIAVGSPESKFLGQVFLYWGGPTLDVKPDRTLTGSRGFEFFGSALAGVGDANGDGYADIWVGAPWFIPFLQMTSERVGRGYLFFGGPTADGVVDALYDARPVVGVRDELLFATSVAAAGDVNHDGYADLIVGQPADGTVTAGRGYVYYGGFPVHRAPDLALLAPEFRFRAGASVSSAGDFNGDGELDQVVGAPDSGEGSELTSGRAYIFYGGQEAPDASTPDLELAGPAGYDAFGAAVVGGRDVNGDGYPDVVVGAPQAEGAAGIRAGRVYVYFGGPGADAIPDVILEGSAPDQTLGTSLSLGDLNGDGVADVIAGAAGLQGSRTDPGHVNVYDLVASRPARVFAHDAHRTIPLNEAGAPIALRVEPVDGSFDPRALDLSSVRLRAAGERTADAAIAPVRAKRNVISDSDGNGIEEAGVSFERSDLATLFAGTHGRRSVAAALEGALVTGERIAGDVTLTIVLTGGDEGGSKVAVAPNPMNPEAVLTFALRVPGRVEARLFDASGRLVRTIAAGLDLPAGPERLRIDGRDDRGRPLASGIYFFRLKTPDGERRGRIVVAK